MLTRIGIIAVAMATMFECAPPPTGVVAPPPLASPRTPDQWSVPSLPLASLRRPLRGQWCQIWRCRRLRFRCYLW